MIIFSDVISQDEYFADALLYNTVNDIIIQVHNDGTLESAFGYKQVSFNSFEDFQKELSNYLQNLKQYLPDDIYQNITDKIFDFYYNLKGSFEETIFYQQGKDTMIILQINNIIYFIKDGLKEIRM